MDVQSAVIGGGVTGLCAGYYLGKSLGRESVAVLEAGHLPGGYAKTEREGGFQFDWGPNGYLNREPLMNQWVEDLGLPDRAVHANEAAAHRFVVKNGRLMEIVPPPGFLISPVLSVWGRARLLCEPFVRPKKDGEPESIWDFAARRIGKEAADTMVAPMVTGIFGGDAKQLSLEHCFPRMAAMEREHGGLFKAMRAKRKAGNQASAMGPSGVLTTFDEGIGVLPETAATALGESLRCERSVKQVTRENGVFRIVTEDGDLVSAERVVIATPPHVAARLVEEMAPDASTALADIRRCNIAVVCTAYPREKVGHDMDGFGFLVPRFEKRRVLGCIWTSSVFPHQAKDGYVLLRTMIGGATDPEAVDLSDEELVGYVRKEVHPLVQIESAPEETRIFRHRNAIPQYGLNHGEILDAIEAAEVNNPGLAFAGNGYRGVGLNDCVVSAKRAVNLVAGEPEAVART